MVANGDKMNCEAVIRKFNWMMQGTKFEAKVLLMSLRGCELILGMEWLNALGVVKWDFPNITMEFQWNGEYVVLNAVVEVSGRWKEVSLSSLFNGLGLLVIQPEGKHQSNGWGIDQGEAPREVKEILKQFARVFEEPKTLPPPRRHDHSIPLEEGMKGLSLRPYRYSTTQKDTI